MFKKGDKVKNVYTQEKREIIAVEKVTIKQNPFTQITVYVLDDKDRWAEDQFYEHWREVE